MFNRIMVAYDESQHAKRALATAIELAKALGARLKIVTVSEPLPPYVSYAEAAFPASAITLTNQRDDFYKHLQEEAKKLVESAGLSVECSLIAGGEVESIIDQIQKWQADLLVIGRHQHLSILTRYSHSTVHDIAEGIQCGILGVY